MCVLSIGADSPVSAASSIVRFIATVIRLSAGTRSPAWSATTSPGTTSRAAMLRSIPSRITWASGAAIFFSASSARSARYSWTKPSNTANSTMMRDDNRFECVSEHARQQEWP